MKIQKKKNFFFFVGGGGGQIRGGWGKGVARFGVGG